MPSSSTAFARPVRSVPASLRKSSTAFSMRVLAAAIASFGVMSFLAVGKLRSEMEIGKTSGSIAAPGRFPISIFHFPFSSWRHCRAHSLAKHHALDVPVLVHVEDHDRHPVVHAQRNGS